MPPLLLLGRLLGVAWAGQAGDGAGANVTCCVFWPLPHNQTRAGCEAGGDARKDGGT